MAEDSRLRLIEVERARRERMAAAADAELGDEVANLSMGEKAATYATNLINEANRGVMEFLPQGMRERMEGVGIGVETDFSNTPGGRGTRFASQGVTMGLPLIRAGQVGPQLMQNASMIRGFVDDLARTAVNAPKTFFGAEAAGGFGAGALGAMAEEGEMGELGQLGAEAVGGLTLGGLASMTPNSLRMMREGFQANLLPFTEQGGMIRAGRQMQARAGGRDASAQAAQRLGEIPTGVTPAQWIGNERLMAQEATILRDNPDLQDFVRRELEEARLVGQQELQDVMGRPRSRQEWEQAVLQRVTPEGTNIELGLTDEMLEEAYQSFSPIYDNVKGFEISTDGLPQNISNAVFDDAIIATDAERDSVRRWFNSVATAFDNQVEADMITSDSLVDMRSKIRDEIRKQSRRGNAERADLIRAIEGQITTRLESGLPDQIRTDLREADSQYRKYKVIEQAIFNAGDEPFTPQDLSNAIQSGGLTTSSRYARGQDETVQELRRSALGGRSTEEVIGNPRRAEQLVRGLSEPEKQAVKADFVDVLFNRALSSEATQSGIPLISGDRLLVDINDNIDGLKNLGFDSFDVLRLKKMADTIQTMGARTSEDVANLFEDGPASILQLAATLAGAKSGQRMAGQGLGSSLVLAQYMSNKARGTLARLTSDEAERLMRDAVTDPDLYRALLTTNTVEPREARQRAQYLEAWLLSAAFDNTGNDDGGTVQ